MRWQSHIRKYNIQQDWERGTVKKMEEFFASRWLVSDRNARCDKESFPRLLRTHNKNTSYV
jgi:hypothetical protein